MAPPRYRAPAADALRTVPLDELTAVFHRPSGQTHLVVSPVPELLAELSGEWTTGDALLARLAERFDLSGAGEALVERLEELAESGLIERG